jgi:hypothetical protein
MSRMLPESTIQAFRTAHNVVVGVMGVDVLLFRAKNSTAIEPLDAYQMTTDRTFECEPTQAFFEWKPEQYRLRKLGLYTEGELPIICHLKQELYVPIGSYIKVGIENIPINTFDTEEFEIISSAVPNVHERMVFQIYKVAPRRRK